MDSVTCHHFVVFVRSVRSQSTNKSTHASRSNTGTSLIKEWKRDRFRSYFSSHPLVLEWSHETGPPPGISQSYHHSFLKTSDCDESTLCNNIQGTNVYVENFNHISFSSFDHVTQITRISLSPILLQENHSKIYAPMQTRL